MSDDWLGRPLRGPRRPGRPRARAAPPEREERRRQRQAKQAAAEEKRAEGTSRCRHPRRRRLRPEPPQPPRTPEAGVLGRGAPEPVPSCASSAAPPEPARRKRRRRRASAAALRRRCARPPPVPDLRRDRGPLRRSGSCCSLFQPFHGDGSGRVAVTVPKGASVSEVGDLLGDEERDRQLDPVPDPRHPRRQALRDLFRPLHPGRGHELRRRDRRALQAAGQAHRHGHHPRGLQPRSQAAQLVEEVGVPGDYTKATIRSKYLNPAEYGGKGAKDLEGFLFPDTFELKPDAPVADLVQLQLQDFKRRIKGVDMGYAQVEKPDRLRRRSRSPRWSRTRRASPASASSSPR